MPQNLPVFLNELIRRPGRVVALAPSSQSLAKAMAAELPDGTGPVVELGPGTGKITQALLDAGVAASDLHAIELSPDFVSYLKTEFPGVTIHQGRAEHLAHYAPQKSVRAVVSGLPLLSMPNAIQEQILTSTRDMLGPDGVFIQFTYGPTPPVAESLRQRLGLRWTKGARIWNNLPPARVYTFRFQPN